jgi:aldose 1-epimerase
MSVKQEAAMAVDNRAAGTMMVPDAPLILRAGSLEAQVHPSCGGRVGRFFRRRADGTEFDVLMPLPPAPFLADAWPKAGCFPMLPYADKLQGNRLQWDDRTVQVAGADDPPWFHGWGLRSAWEVLEVNNMGGTEGHHVAMGLRRSASAQWPWAYHARLDIALDAWGLDISLSLTNDAASTMPAAIGIHPYLRWPSGTQAVLDGRRIWAADLSSPGTFRQIDEEAGRRWLAGDMDKAGTPPNLFYEGWAGHAQVRYPGEEPGLDLRCRTPGFLTTFCPKNGAGYVCLEPVSALPGQFASGVASGATITMHLRLQLPEIATKQANA